MENGRPHKFCKKCAHKLRATLEKLEFHYERQHKHEVPAFLGYGECPFECKYINFLEYLQDPTVELEELRNYAKNKGGRPAKAQEKHAQADASIEAQLPTDDKADEHRAQIDGQRETKPPLGKRDGSSKSGGNIEQK